MTQKEFSEKEIEDSLTTREKNHEIEDVLMQIKAISNELNILLTNASIIISNPITRELKLQISKLQEKILKLEKKDDGLKVTIPDLNNSSNLFSGTKNQIPDLEGRTIIIKKRKI